MKRCWYGGGLLLVLLAAGLFLSLYLGFFYRDLGETMLQTATLSGEDRDGAQQKAAQALEKWERRAFLTAVLCDHAPMEAIEENFRLLVPHAEQEDFRETCLRLSSQLKALGEGQLLSWENLF